MARLLGPTDTDTRFVVANTTTGDFITAAGATARIYTDASGTVLADIAAYDPNNPTVPGASISPTGTLIVDQFSMLPIFWLPDGAAFVYVSVSSGPLIELREDTETRIEALETGESGVPALTTQVAANTSAIAGNAAAIAAEVTRAQAAEATNASASAANAAAISTETSRATVAETTLSASVTTQGVLVAANAVDISVAAAPYSAVGNGATNDAPAIQAALNAALPGQIVRLGPHTYRLNAPLVVPPQVTLSGSHGSRITYAGAAVNTSILQPSASFSGSGVVLFNDKVIDGRSLETVGQRVENIDIDGSLLPAGTVHGILASGIVRDVFINRVCVRNVTGSGFATATYDRGDGNPVKAPYSWYMTHCMADSNGGYGYYLQPHPTDGYVSNCQAINNALSGFFIQGAGSGHFTDCRSEWNGGHGYLLTGDWLSGVGSGGCVMTGCATDRNANHGMSIIATGTGPITLNGLMLHRDGRNGGSGGGNFAGLRIAGCTMPVVINGLTCMPGVDDGGAGTSSPQIGVSIAASVHVLLSGSYVHAATTAIFDGGGNTTFVVAPSVGTATGSTSSPTRVPGAPWTIQGAGVINGTTETTGLLTADQGVISAGEFVSTASLARLGILAGSDRAKSVAASTQAWTDTTVFSEAWASLGAWTQPGTPGMQVSAGKLFGLGSGNAGANHSYIVGSTSRVRAVLTVNIVAGLSGGSVIVGFSSDTAGGAPALAAANVRGLQFASDGQVKSWTLQTTANLGAWGAGAWTITLLADDTGMSAVATSPGLGSEFRAQWARSGFNLNNLFVFCSDARALSGCSVGPIAARPSLATTQPAASVEGTVRSVAYTVPDGTHNARVCLPLGYDSRVPAPLVLFCHGSTGNETTPAGNAGSYSSVAAALEGAGFIVAGTVGTPGDEWGNQSIQDSTYKLYQYVRDRYAIGPVVLWGGSMGGLASLNLLAARTIPGVVAWMGNQPVCSLAAAYSNASFTAGINTAYSIAGDYAAKTAGYDPLLKLGAAFRGVPMWSSSSPGDTAVPKVSHTDALFGLVAPYALSTTLYTATGDHSDPSEFQPATQLAWLQSVTAG